MTIEEFERRVWAATSDSEGFTNRDLTMCLCGDGCLSSRLDGSPILSEGYPWAQALDIICAHVEAHAGSGREDDDE